MRFTPSEALCATVLSVCIQISFASPLPVVDIGTIGNSAIFGNDLSEDGHVAGTLDDDTAVRGFFWTPQAGIVDPFEPNHQSVYETASIVNSSGVRAGFYRVNGQLPINGVIFGDQPGTLTPLQKIDGVANSSATPNAGNANDQIVGTAQIQQGPSFRNRAALWDSQGNVTNLGTLGGIVSSAVGINDAGVVIGSSRLGTNTRAFRWTSTDGMVALPTMTTEPNEDSSAFAINGNGWIVGNSNLVHDDGTVITTEFMGSWLYTGGDSVQPLGLFVANDVNDNGIIVGSGMVDDGLGGHVQHGFVRVNGVWTDLNTLIDPALNLEITNASDVNNTGQVLCAATSLDPNVYAFHTILVSVPEPGLLSGMGALTMLLLRPRRWT